jgi:hypothetical protein
VVLLFALSATATFASADTVSAVNGRRKGRPLRCFVDVGSLMGIHSTEFFTDYKRYLTGPSTTFNAPEIVRFGIGSYQIQNIAMGLTGGYYRAVLRETYQFRPELSDVTAGIPAQTLTQELVMTAFPAMVTADYLPLGRQFTTYVGAGIGLNIVSVSWREALSESQAPGARASGERYDGTHLVPTAMLRSGVSLGLDKVLSATISAALHVEVSYVFSNLSAPLFERLASRFPGADGMTAAYTVAVGGLGIHAGLSFFLR